MGESAGQAPAPVAVEGAEFAVELAQGLTALRLGFGGDKIGDRLGLGQVELAVEEGAAGEFAGLGEPQTEPAQRPRDRGQHRTAAVQVEFGDILAGGAARSGKPQQQPVVDRLAAARIDKACAAGRVAAAAIAGERPHDAGRIGAGNADDRNRTRSRGRRRGEDRIRSVFDASDRVVAPLPRNDAR